MTSQHVFVGVDGTGQGGVCYNVPTIGTSSSHVSVFMKEQSAVLFLMVVYLVAEFL